MFTFLVYEVYCFRQCELNKEPKSNAYKDPRWIWPKVPHTATINSACTIVQYVKISLNTLCSQKVSQKFLLP